METLETFAKTYQPDLIEKKWYQCWEKAGYFKPQGGETSYCIMLPPPNVTGTLHMGHGFQDTLMDALIRYHRMQGHNTLWQGGTDHAGIATQIVVERQLAQQGKTRHDLGRELFTQKIWEWKQSSGSTICEQMRRIGTSVDWSRERFTMDPALNNAVNKVFVQLFDEGYIYRGKRLVNWDPKLHTAISDLEVHTEEEDGFLWHIRYPLADKSGHIVVATTRPETLLGDVAVAVHPEDPRYQAFIGKQLQLPLCDRTIPIIADNTVLQDFGTGCVKITPAHDFNDYEMGKRHQLPFINIFTVDADINETAPAAYQGLSRFKAREKIVADLEQLQLLDKVEPYRIKIPRGEKSGEIVEPYLTDQWFVKMESLAQKAVEVVKSGETQFVPEHWADNFYQWMDNIQDWCISRQIWWGHRIPAWYDAEGKFYVGMNEEEVRAKHQLAPSHLLTQDHDVLDTWFSSALWPFSTLGWPQDTADLKSFYPTQVLVTGFDIIFFWVARMIMMGVKLTGKTPFKKVYVHGLILDPEGQKMSKSKGNIIDPIDIIDGISLEALIEKRTSNLMQPKMAEKITAQTRKQFPEGIARFGTDPLRFTYCALATTGRFIRFDFARVEGYRFFCNKLWNASRYVMMQCEGKSVGINESEREYTLADLWILSLWQKTKTQVAEYFESYRFDLLAQTLYEFTWDQFCDWYLELSKPILNQPDQTVDSIASTSSKVHYQQNATRYTLMHILDELLRTLHPIIPFITEEIWQIIKPCLDKAQSNKKISDTSANISDTSANISDTSALDFSSIMLAPYPQAQIHFINENAESEIQFIKDVIIGIRNIRGEMNINPGKKIPLLYRDELKSLTSIIENNRDTIQILAKLSSITALAKNQTPPESASNIIQGVEIFIPLEGLIDHAAEIKRLEKEIEKLALSVYFAKIKIENPTFLEKAPKAVVALEQERLETAINNMAALKKALDKIQKFSKKDEPITPIKPKHSL